MKKILLACAALTYGTVCLAADKLELLNEHAIKSQLASESILLNIMQHNESLIAVGERGHIIEWENPNKWSQFSVPVSVTITDVTQLKNGNFVAVGHDAAILLFNQNTKKWTKVFDGYDLTKLVISSLAKQILAQEARLQDLPEDADRYEEEYRLEDLEYAHKDAQTELDTGPNKPLLSVITADNGDVFVTGAYGVLLRSKDEGLTWDLVSNKIDNIDKFHLNSIVKDVDGALYIVGENAVAARSSDNGNTWESMELPYHGSFFGVIASQNSKHLIAFGLQGHFAVSNDSGLNWRLIEKKLSSSFLGGTVSDKGIAYLVGHGGLVLSFPLDKPNQQTIYKHPSGATFSAVTLEGNKQLVLVGQQGITRWNLGK
ncbi:WD40/YVTN/BNR-like repeat-containing protein [Glaciecola sp. MF2-115]|uniref:WD40/YVTN/BNR-like repeat-containing protein n=1 Tax=Glaciecola sp. MF2-115 TaxID=3384827 RepID=UPI0039A34617